MADNTNEIVLTPEGKQKLLDELELREGEVNDRIIKALEEARSFGDLSENAEYDAAREDKDKNDARISEIRRILAVARVEEGSDEEGAPEFVSINTIATLRDAKGNEVDFSIVGTTEIDSLKRKISSDSPLGAALIGHKEGDQVEYITPSGKTKTYTIMGISRSGISR